MDAVAFRLRIFLIVLTVVLTLGTGGFVVLEGLSPVDAVYFSVVTVATVGYGDIHPKTRGGKLLAVALIVTGVGTFLGVVANGTDLLVERRQERMRQQRRNTVIALFFSEIGDRLLHLFVDWDPDVERVREHLLVGGGWSGRDFTQAAHDLERHAFAISVDRMDLEQLRSFLQEKRDLLLRLLENPNLLEHETFTELLRAVFHLKDELLTRRTLEDLPESDREHLANDARRAYRLVVPEWLGHLAYLKDNYPYLFSLAARTNPFCASSSPVVA